MDIKRVRKKLNNKGFTMMEIIITVAIVSIFFLSISIVVPQSLDYYILMEKTSTAIELTDIIENGLGMELAGAASIAFDDSVGITYINGEEIRKFPANKDLSKLNMKVSVDDKKLEVTGRPYIWRSVYDDELYGQYTAKILLTQDDNTGNINIKVTIFDENNDSVCTTTKPVIMYN